MTKLAPEWVRTSDPVIRSPARYRWTTTPARFFDFIECFTTTFLRAHSWLNWVVDACPDKSKGKSIPSGDLYNRLDRLESLILTPDDNNNFKTMVMNTLSIKPNADGIDEGANE